MRARRVAAVLLVLAVASCVTEVQAQSIPSTPSLAIPPASSSCGPPPLAAERAAAHLASRLGVPLRFVSVVCSCEVTWSDSSLGFPEPMYMYLPVLTPGHRVFLRAGQRIYEVHTDREGLRVKTDPLDRPELDGSGFPETDRSPSSRASHDIWTCRSARSSSSSRGASSGPTPRSGVRGADASTSR